MIEEWLDRLKEVIYILIVLLLLYLSGELSQLQLNLMENEGNPVYKFYKHYKYYHFYSVCFGLGCSMVSYRPFRSVWFPSVLGVFSTIVFEILGIALDLPAHTKECKGPPYNKRDVYWGFCLAIFVAILNLHFHHVYTLSYGCGIIMFALRGVKRKYSFLRKLRQKRQAWRYYKFTTSDKRGWR